MNLRKEYNADILVIKEKQGHLGDDFWTTTDNRIGKGSPFSARDVGILLTELGFTGEDPEIQGIASRIFMTWRPDGRFKISPSGAIYPCHTITALRVLCTMGYAHDPRLQATFDHLAKIQHVDGGWRCNKIKLGKSMETDGSNPGVTLEALDAFRFIKDGGVHADLDRAVETLLRHWNERRPWGPCHFGIGSLFMQSEYPFLRYNLFYYCFTLSFYHRAKKDPRFQEALALLDEKVRNQQFIVENPHRRLGQLKLCKRGQPSALATKRYNELKRRMEE